MSLKYSCIHKIERVSPDTTVIHQIAEANKNNDNTHQTLFDQLKHVFHTHVKKQYGYFDPDRSDQPLPGWVQNYTQKKISFPKLNQYIAAQLKQLFETVNEVFEYYLWVVIEPEPNSGMCYFFLLSHDTSHQISYDISVEESYSINPNKLKYATKIDITEWLEQHTQTYLSFLSPKTNSPIKVTFSELIGFSEGVNRAVQTDEFLNVVEQYADSLPPEEEQEYRNRVIDYCMNPERQGDPVEIQALSQYVDEESPDAFMRFAVDHSEDPSVILFPDRNRLKRYSRFYGRDSNVNISFPAEMFGNEVLYDELTDTLTIRAIPRSLKSQLKKHLRKTG